MPAARLPGLVRGHGRRRAVLRHVRSRAGRLADRHGGLTADRHHGRRQGIAGFTRLPGFAGLRQRQSAPRFGQCPRVVPLVVVAQVRVRPAVAVPVGPLGVALRVGAQFGFRGGIIGAGPPRRGPGPGAGRAAPGPARDGARQPRGAGAQAVLLPLGLRCPGGAGARGQARPHGGLLHQVRPPVLVRAEAARGRHRARPVRGRGLPRARRPRLDLSRRRPRGVRPLGGPQGPPRHRRPGRHGRRDLRAPLPRRDRARQHRPHLQLRRAPRPAHRLHGRLHRHGVRRRKVPQGDRQRPPDAGRTPRSAARRTGLRVRHRGAGGARPPAQP
ncbi:hypothetical protein STSP_13880 [Streptomyces jeddahensis]|uniref:Uncharacterized protein n=1 Tax=Streptomyces jeddahensis TaxID=1716141 RepID=A0A177HX64_9ACTN|nr:hypothetical protein STSP_13880 [Streptomyces jeddahensis]